MTMKRLLALALAAALCVIAPAPPAGGAPPLFGDVDDPDMLHAVRFLSNLGFIAPAEKFNPGDVLDKAGYCKLVVDMAGVENIDGYRGYTVFTDVRANHWALPYINAAVRELKIVTGRPDGTFGPSDPITYSQAATLMVRMLGYAEAEVGYNWPKNYITKAESLGLNRNVGEPEYITRGQAAILFYNLLFTGMKGEGGKDGALYLSRMKNLSEPFDIIIEDVDGLSPDGAARGIRTVGGAGFYIPLIPVDKSLAGFKVKVLTDTDGNVLMLTPYEQTFRDIDLKTAAAMGITDAEGETVTVPAKTDVYDNGGESSYSQSWKDMKPGDNVRVFFTASGAVDYIMWGHYDPNTAVVITTESKGDRAIYNAFNINPNTVTVFKNGAKATADSIVKYDTLSHTPGSGVVTVSSVRVNAYYPGSPSADDAPESLSVMGLNLPLSEGAKRQVLERKYKIGDWVTACISADGVIGALYTHDEAKPRLTGWSLSDSSMETFNGLVFTGSRPSPYVRKGMLVSGSSLPGGLSMSPVSLVGTAHYSVTEGKIGVYDVAEWCKFFVTAGSFVAPISFGDIQDSFIHMDRVKHIAVSEDRKAEIIVLEGVNEDALFFGYMTIPDNGMDFSAPALFNSGGQIYEVTTGTAFMNEKFDTFIGIALESHGDELRLERVSKTYSYTVGSADIRGKDYIMIEGNRVPIAEGCLLRRPSVSNFLDINLLPQYKAETYTVWTDRPADANGAKVRQIVIR